MSNSISTRLIVVLSLCTSIIVGLGMALDYRLSRKTILERMQLQADEKIEVVVSDLENLLDGVEGSTLFFGRILQQREYSVEGLRQMLQGIVENNQDIFGAAIGLNPALTDQAGGFAPYYYQKDGIPGYSDLSQTQDTYWQQAWYLDAVSAEKPVWIEPYFDSGGGNVWMTTFSVPVYRFDEQGDRFLFGVVTADITLDALHHYLQNLRLGNTGFGILLSKTGSVLSAGSTTAEMQSALSVTGREISPQRWQQIQRALRNGQELSSTIDCPHAYGECTVRLGALHSTGWPVGVIYSQTEVLAPLREFEIKAALLAVVTLLLMALAVYAVTRRLTRPLVLLARASDDIARGRLDTALPAARGNDEIARLVRSFGGMKRDLKSYIADLEMVTASRSRLEGELAAAREIQMSMLPGRGEATERDEDYALWARVRPAKSTGGDLYAYHRSDRQLFIAVGDVSDKGVPAALFMAKAISLIQQLADTQSDPASAMTWLNNALEAGNDNCMFVTLFLGVLDLDSLQMQFASAGHTPPSLQRGDTVESLQQQDGAALGLALDLQYPTNTLQLQPGDRLAIYTDGIDEAFDANGNMFGVPAFNHILYQQRQSDITAAGEAVLQALDTHAGGAAQFDDITLLLLQLPDKAGLAAANQSTVENFPRGEKLVSRVQQWLQSALEELQVPADFHMDLQLVAEEIISNIDHHAGLAPDATIELGLTVKGASVTLQAKDDGRPFNPLVDAVRATLGTDIDAAEIGGVGVHLIMQLTDHQEYRRDEEHNILRVSKRLPRGPN